MSPILKTIVACTVVLAAGHAYAESLYREDTFRSMVADNKARKVGDAITVLVYENSSATSGADTTAGRKAGLGIDWSDSLHRGRVANLATRNDFDGRGTTQRVGRLLAQIAVTVTAVEPNGELRIAGEQLLEINREKQQIKLEGRVRPQDVTDANTVMSTRIAEARISYVGDGDVASRARPSWWHNLLTWIGL
jgi:flagellar L-ring protein precursor FlgH